MKECTAYSGQVNGNDPGKGKRIVRWKVGRVDKGVKVKQNNVPNLRNQVVNGVPGEWTKTNRSPPTHSVGGKDVGVSVKVVCDWDF